MDTIAIDKTCLQETEMFIFDTFEVFMQKHDHEDKYKIDPFIVMDIAKRFHMDETRIKSFHPDIKGLDKHKKAGYLTYWTSKLKPILLQDLSFSPEKSKASHYVNEMFATCIGFGKIDCFQNPANKIGADIITADFMTVLLYTLKYRITTGDDLSMLFYFVDERVKIKQIKSLGEKS